MRALFTLVVCVFAISLSPARAGQDAAPCQPAGSVQFVCGQDAPEDLVLLPGSQWVVASVFSPKGGIRLIDTQNRTTTIAYPTADSKERFDAKTYKGCPGPPSAEQKSSFRTHGLALRPAKDSLHTLYVVHHGTRESIEVFELDARAKTPVLTWVGCAVAPDPVGLNEVVALPGGGFVATDFLARGIDAAARGRMLAGEPNGALWEWQPGTGWTMLPGSEASGANGLEISPDGQWFYVAAWGSQSFFRLSRGQTPAKRDVVPLGFRADNVRWAPDGLLLVAGQGGTAPEQTTNVVKIDPNTLKVTEVIRQPNSPEFGAGTVALQVGKEIWVGSFRGDRIARFSVP
jgi:DNA-binding beta-propeller fold protein YncE